MESKRFAAWTRRRFGLVSGGAVAALLGLAGRDDAAGKKRKRTKDKSKKKNQDQPQDRCKNLGQSCDAASEQPQCCTAAHRCEVASGGTSPVCCLPDLAPCANDADCCGFAFCVAGNCDLL